MTLDAALALIAELQAHNVLLRKENAALQARVRALEQRIAELEAEKRPPPPWAKSNRVKREKPTDEQRRQRAPEHDRGRPRGTPTQYIQHAYEHYGVRLMVDGPQS